MSRKKRIEEMYEEYKNDPEFVKGQMVTDLLGDIFRIMELNNISNSELAKRMNVSRQYITKLFNGYANFTLMTIAQIAVALNMKPEISLKNIEENIEINVDNDVESVYSGYINISNYNHRKDYHENHTVAA